MNSRITTVAFYGIDAVQIDVQVQMFNGIPGFNIVGLPNKSVAESKERIRACLASLGINFPSKRITVNLSPADVQKEGSHYDLPIALALLCAMGIIPQSEIDEYIAVGELALDGSIKPVSGVLPAAICAKSINHGLICPACSAKEALWAGQNQVLAAPDLMRLINHLNGRQVLDIPELSDAHFEYYGRECFSDIKGQVLPKRGMEIAAAGGHNILLSGPPGVGKSLLASRMNSLLPPLNSQESLEVTMIYSLINALPENGLITKRPYRAPHHSASLVALVGGGVKAQPGEISLAHRGVLFLDELPEFSRMALEALRQPLETGNVSIARANSHITYPARIQLIAAMNPCKCGFLGTHSKECRNAPTCGKEYMQRISGPLLDRFDLIINLESVSIADFQNDKIHFETSEEIRQRVIRARNIQEERYKLDGIFTNAESTGTNLEKQMDLKAKEFLFACVDKFEISARGFYKIMKTARTIADLAVSNSINEDHIAEAVSYRHRL